MPFHTFIHQRKKKEKKNQYIFTRNKIYLHDIIHINNKFVQTNNLIFNKR